MKKKRPLHRQPSKTRKKSVTGIEDVLDRFIVGGESKIAGFMHVLFGPRRAEEYSKMRVTDLVRRIEDDLRELLERAYPTAAEERLQQKFGPNYCPAFAITYENRLLYSISQSVAEELCRGLWERLISPDTTVSSQADEEYQRLLPQGWQCDRDSRAGGRFQRVVSISR